MLKIIACASMLIDHAGVVFGGSLMYRAIGRVAFPIYAYMIAQGCKHTKDIKKYMLRLFIFALISEVPFDIAHSNGYTFYIACADINFISSTNIFYTLFLGVSGIAVYEKLRSKGQAWFSSAPAVLVSAASTVAALPFIAAAYFLDTDYGMFGVVWIFALYVADPENRLTRALVLAAGIVYRYWVWIDTYVYVLAFALLAVLFVSLYNGEQGPRVKWAFYVFYPAHLAVLAAIWFVFASAFA